MKKNINLGFVGLTHLGLSYLAASTKKGFRVVGVDLNKKKINKLKKFEIEYSEPYLRKAIYKNKKKIIFFEFKYFNKLSRRFYFARY